MYHLAYFSTATKHFTEAELFQLLQTSRKNNSKLGITGVLLFIEGCFLQILEGQKKDVFTVFKKIQSDNRHYNLFKLYEKEAQQRVFKNWSMGFKNIPFIEYKTYTGFEDISNEFFIDNIIKTNHPRIIQTLHDFYSDGL